MSIESIRLWLRALVARGAVDHDLDREMGFHLEMAIEKYRRSGLSLAEATRRARLDFGGVERFKEAVRDERGVRPLDDFVMDLRYAFRGLRRAPAFTIAALIVLGLGIGAATSVAAIVDHVLRRPLPFPEADRLVFLTEATAAGDPMLTSYPNFDDWRARSRSFTGLTAFMPVFQDAVFAGGAATRERVQFVSREFFGVFGVRPLVGRVIRADENRPGAPPVAVVSERFWRSRLGAPTDLTNATLKRQGLVHSVVGVMPAGFRVLEEADIWVGAESVTPVLIRGAGNYWVVGRLAPSTTLDQARQEMNAIAASLKAEHGDASISSALFTTSFLDRVVGSVRRSLLVLLGASVFVLVGTCACIATMQLARAASRDREIGIRTALGARRLRLVRQLVTDQLLLAVLGCSAGMGVAWALIELARRFGAGLIPRLDEVRLDPLTLGAGVAVSVLAVLLFGSAPLLRLLRHQSLATARAMRPATGARQRRAYLLIGVQAAVSVLLVVGAALLVRTVYNVLTVDLGYDRQGLISVNVPLGSARYNPARERLAAMESIRDALGDIPGVREVALTTQLPSQWGGNRGPILVPPFGDPNAQDSWATIASLRVVTPDYFRVMRIPLLRGRPLDERDRDDSRSVVVNRALAERLWPAQDAIGRQLRALVDGRNDTLTVVGVVADARDWQSAEGAQQELYLTVWQRPEIGWQVNAILRAPTRPGPVIAEAERRVRQLDPELAPVARTVDQTITDSIADRRFIGGVVVAFAAVVLLLTTAGIVGSVVYAVEQRSREIGIRRAMGATRGDVWILVQRGVLRSVVVGGAVGVILSLQATRYLTTLLYQVSPSDTATLVSAVALTATAMALGAALPALRALRVDPIIAIRAE